ncbi:hypothetical protein [Nocardia sp. BMG51109]|uniref:DUF7373 family lipoprotein n=1 Tax=Nocardia sp. BMG51109 TaxID=1056816 RepID=UPI0012EC433A|nr:hypothetical protein [Nocardia sp. BMG51109]
MNGSTVMRGMRGLAGAVVAVGLVVALSGCGSTIAGTAGPSEVDIRKLDVGSYPIEPVDIYADYRPGFYAMGGIGAMRLADYVATAVDVDPRLTFSADSGDFSAGVMDSLLGKTEATEEIAKRNKMLFGFKSEGGDRLTSIIDYGWPEVSRHTPGATTVNMLVMQFPDADSAQRAAHEFYQADVEANKDRTQPIRLSKYADAQGQWRPGSPTGRSFLAHGSYVAAAVVTAAQPDQAAISSLSEKAYDTQLPLLDQLKPISDEETLHLPWDQDHILSRTLNPEETYKPGFTGFPGIYGRRGILQFLPYRAQAKQTFEAIGADRFAITDAALLARAESDESAKRAAAERLSISPVAKQADAPANVPDSTCVENKVSSVLSSDADDKRFTCIVVYRQYVSYLSADQLLDAHQRAAAQYALLANSQWQP